MSALSPKLSKVLELWRRTENDGERQSARATAEKLCAQAGMSFQDAVAKAEVARAGGRPVHPLAGFDDWMEAKEPGYKASCRAEHEAKEDARLARVADLIHRHGSKQAVIAPCEREQLLIAAVAEWRKTCKPPHQRWTKGLDGWEGSLFDPPPPHVEAAIRDAYPLPQTVAAAVEEYSYWRARESDLDDILDSGADTSLDLVAYLRMDICRNLALRELPVTNLRELIARMRFCLENEVDDPKIEASNLADLERLVDQQEAAGRAPVQREQIEAALRHNPARADRAIARELGVSPTTVGKARAKLGLAAKARSVQRRGQTFTGRYGRSADRDIALADSAVDAT
jgi:hypothetical protein